ncbi:hypothetical protein PVAND_011117 [Polypedilum vanderplanki]|uniref:Protein brambleberry-like n=1 Tax=Polypedilum vanderplanki TaxID=319348 RepID=A0A9J6CJ04_POLVA|nr:hypothetical protein PVAND_011117 [Polypedilum vanderplanki]
MKNLKIIVLLILSSPAFINGSLLGDFFSDVKSLWPKHHDLEAYQSKKLTDIRFELPVESEEFLKEGLELINAPKESLDLCTHRVILQLKKNCNQLSQNDISKLAVMLMNCELESEGRTTYPCKPEMTIAQCTLPFDNSLQMMYAITKNRALSICAALKHEQFRMATESAVNHLMKLAVSQSQVAQESLQNQRRVNEISLQNMQEFQENHDKIKELQIQNLEHLNNANVQLNELTIDLQRVFVINQNTEQKTINIEKLTEDIASKLQESASSIQKQNEAAQEFMERFKHIMQIISAITYTLELTFSKIEEIFNEIGLQVSQEFLVFMLLNIFYFTCCMIFIIFMNMNRRCKQILIGLFIFNAAASYFNSEIPIASFNIFIWISYICFYFSGKLKEKIFTLISKSLNFLKFCTEKKRQMREKSMSRARSKTPIVETQKYQKNKAKNNNEEDDDDLNSELAELCEREEKKIEIAIATATTVQQQPARSETPLNRPMTPAMARVMSSEINRSGTPFQFGMPGRIQCQATTNKGAQCRNAALVGYSKCKIHNYE